MFRGWFSMRPTCAVCDLRFEDKPGDTWGFWVVGDRIFLFAALIALYFGFRPETWLWRGVFFLIVAGPLVLTMPQRQGAFLALDYVSRTRWRQ
jgi:uncharacterized protein (DUF983 family)